MWLVWHEFHDYAQQNRPGYVNVDAASAVEFVYDLVTTALEAGEALSLKDFRAKRDDFLKECDEAAL
jgi:hypothetical protein